MPTACGARVGHAQDRPQPDQATFKRAYFNRVIQLLHVVVHQFKCSEEVNLLVVLSFLIPLGKGNSV